MHHGFLLKELVRRDLQSRYRGSLFGFLWAFVHPLWQLALLWVVFSVILKVPLTGERTAMAAMTAAARRPTRTSGGCGQVR